MHRYDELKVWNEAVEFFIALYKLNGKFSAEERYALTSQVRRSGASIPSNMAEGAGRNTNGEFVQFPGVANGSIYEVDTQLIIAKRLKYITDKKINISQRGARVKRAESKLFLLRYAGEEPDPDNAGAGIWDFKSCRMAGGETCPWFSHCGNQ